MRFDWQGLGPAVMGKSTWNGFMFYSNDSNLLASPTEISES